MGWVEDNNQPTRTGYSILKEYAQFMNVIRPEQIGGCAKRGLLNKNGVTAIGHDLLERYLKMLVQNDQATR